MSTLLTDHIAAWTSALQTKATGGRDSNGKHELYGINKARELIVKLAVKGRLVPQFESDKPTDESLARARSELASQAKGARRSLWKESRPISADEQLFVLPKNWAWARLNDTGFYVNGLAFRETDWGTSGRPIIRIQNLTDRSRPLNYAKGDFPETIIVRSGDLLVSWSATLDCFIWNGEEALLNQHIFKVSPCSELVIDRFLYWLLKFSIGEMKESDHAHGLVMTHINREPFLAHVVAIPPVAEQRRIVAKLDELMALCDQLERQHAECIESHQTLVQSALHTLIRVASRGELTDAWARLAGYFDVLFSTEHSIDQLKQTIVQVALMGNLVPQDPDDEPASALLEKICMTKVAEEGRPKRKEALTEVAVEERPYLLPEQWQWARFGSLVNFRQELVRPEDHKELDQVAPDSIEKGTGRLLFRRTVSESGVRGPNNRFYRGQILYSKIRPSLSKAIIAPFDGLCSADMYPLESLIEPTFLLKAILSESFLQQVRVAENRIKMPKLNIESLSQILVPVPPRLEQVRIVAKVDELVAMCDELKARFSDRQTTEINLADAVVALAVA